MEEEVYKGYTIKYKTVGDEWGALIWAPGSPALLGGGVPRATRVEGMGVLRARAYARVEEDIAKTKAPP
ncbi:hypothetical protein GA0061098_103425 [Bradyrhizobium shewense]|uniref:Uncharacterized protein n=1 Tax=Bradyrhizobium shewense TaxID=1761772 RepID=A0A1C3XS00_9BRAD|nr:hypothetical protein GA0061098_103425 [Bradyrhizobium shewense]